jgi:hypothetical protein
MRPNLPNDETEEQNHHDKSISLEIRGKSFEMGKGEPKETPFGEANPSFDNGFNANIGSGSGSGFSSGFGFGADVP